MDIVIVGLGKMGGNMAERLLKGGHAVVGVDPSPEAAARVKANGGTHAPSITAGVAALKSPGGSRHVWLMIPAGAPVDAAIAQVLPVLSRGDTIIDGGNSNYKDTMRRAEALAEEGLEYVDVGTSGGVWGLTEGYSMMVGGTEAAVERLRPILESLAPGKAEGWGRVGPSGAGHFVKMVHNGIEYGMMQAFAEGFAIFHKKKEFALDLPQIAEIWRNGSVVRSWLLDLLARALQENPKMEGIAPFVPDSGEGRWTVFEAVDLDVPAPVITASLMTRFRSRDQEAFYDRLLSALRNQFGGHSVKRE